MSDIVKTIDPWFLNLLVIILAAYFLWSVKGLFKDLRESILELKKLITELYDGRNDHEKRITALETKCAWEHGENPARRATDHP